MFGEINVVAFVSVLSKTIFSNLMIFVHRTYSQRIPCYKTFSYDTEFLFAVRVIVIFVPRTIIAFGFAARTLLTVVRADVSFAALVSRAVPVSRSLLIIVRAVSRVGVLYLTPGAAPRCRYDRLRERFRRSRQTPALRRSPL